MATLEGAVDEVIAAFRARRRMGWSATGPSLTGAGDELGPWKERIDARLKRFRRSVVDRGVLLERVRRRLEGAEWSVDFAAVADELQEMARDDLRAYLTDNGMPEVSARAVAQAHSIGALLHDS